MSNEGSPYGKAFVIRMLVLLVILVAAVGGFFYDQKCKETANKKVDEIHNLLHARTDDGGGIPQSHIRETVGNSARLTSREHVRKKTGKTYEVDTFSFKRVMPFMTATTIDVAYLEKAMVFVSKPGEAKVGVPHPTDSSRKLAAIRDSGVISKPIKIERVFID